MKFFLGCIHGVLFASMAGLYVLSIHEDQLFDEIVSAAIDESMSEEAVAIRLMETTHDLLEMNFAHLSNTHRVSIRQKLLNSSDIQLASPKGHCGSYAHVLARLLQRADFEVRMVQMDCSNGKRSCHILVEANIDDKFRVLDAMYSLSFNKNGSLATFPEISKDWAFYSQQAPKSYPQSFDYHHARYTNWNKVPVLMPALHNILSWFIGPKVDQISLRVYFLNVYKTYFFILIAVYIFAVLCYLFKRGVSIST